MKLKPQLIASLRKAFKGNIVPLYLTLLEWIDKKTGEAVSSYVMTSNPRVTIEMKHSVTGSVSVESDSQSTDDNITIWMREMTEDLSNIYRDEGLDYAEFNLDTQTLAYPNENRDDVPIVEHASV